MRRIIDFFKSLLGICETKPLSPNLWSVEEDQVRVKLGEAPELSETGNSVYLKGQGLHKPVLVVRTEENQYLAFTNRCTHLGHRKLDPVSGQQVLRCCSLSHSTFDFDGNRLSGPAKEPLTRHEVEMSDGDLLIKLQVPEKEGS